MRHTSSKKGKKRNKRKELHRVIEFSLWRWPRSGDKCEISFQSAETVSNPSKRVLCEQRAADGEQRIAPAYSHSSLPIMSSAPGGIKIFSGSSHPELAQLIAKR